MIFDKITVMKLVGNSPP